MGFDRNRMIIRNGRVIDPETGLDGHYDISLSDGKIASIRRKGDMERGLPSQSSVIDAKGLLVIPGLVDIHAHLREPGYEYKETIATGTMAAAAGGFTSIACMANTNPVNDNGSVTRYILKKAEVDAVIDLFPIGSATRGMRGKIISEMAELKEAGCVAVSDDGLPILDGAIMRRALEYARMFDFTVISHCEDPFLTSDGVMNEGLTSTRLGLKGIPGAAEEAMVARDISIAALTGGRLHIAHISTIGSVELVRAAKKRGVNVTCEVTPHHLTLTEDVLSDYSTNAKMNPPLRTDLDREAVIQGLLDGTIDCIATDHAPHSSVEKDVEFDRAANGIVGLETAFPLIMGLVNSGRLKLVDAIGMMTVKAANIIGLEKGRLSVGRDADITLIDLDREWLVDSNQFFSKGRNTPFDGWRMKGKVVKTISRGKVVYSEKGDSDTR